MKVAVEAMEGCKRRLNVEAPSDVVQKEWEKAYGRVQKQARLPGFRKGHVPRSLVKVHFADEVRREVAEHLIPDVYRQAISEAQLRPVDEPNLENVTLEEGAPLSFVAVVEVRPEITLGDYKDVEVQHETPAIADEQVNEALEHMASSRPSTAPLSVRPGRATSSSSTTRWLPKVTMRRPRTATSSSWAAGRSFPRSIRRWRACRRETNGTSRSGSPTTTGWRRCAARAGRRTSSSSR